MSVEAIIIGAGVVDIPLCPVSEAVFQTGSFPLNDIRMQAGGDALNESVILSRLGHRTALVSVLGSDAPGDYLRRILDENGVDTRFVRSCDEHPTGINIVLVRENGERSFITNRKSTLRTLALKDILPLPEELRSARIACLASTFVSPALPVADMTALLRELKALGMTTCADTTRPKNGETAADMKELLPLIDFYFPNIDEARALTGETEPGAIADAFLANGLNTLVLKLGARGCMIATKNERYIVPAVSGTNCIDTTGAGDNFAAGFIAALLENKTVPDCAAFAHAAASVCVEHVGTTTGVNGRDVVEARLERIRPPHAEG